MNVLFIDTETTGKLLNHLPPEHPAQPRVVQLAAVLADGPGKILGQLCLHVQPDGWKVPDDARRIHGISTETCFQTGIPLSLALELLDTLCLRAETIVAHNLDFDFRVLMSEFDRMELPIPRIQSIDKYCTMKAATPIVQLPGRYGDFKWPTLVETHRHFFQADFDGAHDALADVLACMRIYYAMNPAPEVPSEAVEATQVQTSQEPQLS